MNPILTQLVQATYESLKQPQLQPVIQKMVQAGEKFLYSEETRDLLVQQLNEQGEPDEVIGDGVAKLMAILLNQSKGTAPMEVLIPASAIILCEALDLLEQSGQVQLDNEFVAQCFQSMTSSLLQLLGVTPEKMEEMVGQAQGSAAPGAADSMAPATGSAAPAAPGGGIIQSARGGM